MTQVSPEEMTRKIPLGFTEVICIMYVFCSSTEISMPFKRVVRKNKAFFSYFNCLKLLGELNVLCQALRIKVKKT